MPRLEAAIFDLDGVVTRTARLHQAAWKRTFDPLLARRGEPPFEDADYRAHVDGKPRLDGVRAFLAARGISLPDGSPGDRSGADTVHAIAAAKQQRFLELVEERGVEVDPAAVELLETLGHAGLRLGVATSSKNGAAILRRAGLDRLFEARVDGVVSAQLGLAGKPAPDIFLECARRLNAAPEGSLVVEDAAPGVAAGRAGGFAVVLGVDRGDNWLRLREAGADWIVRDLHEVGVESLDAWLAGRPHAKPSALAAWPAIADELRGRRLSVFLDYDGTLTPIVARPEDAVLSEDMRETLRRLAAAWPTQLVSGRASDDVRALVGIDTLWVAGSHGFDIVAPRDAAGGKQVAPELEPDMHAAAAEIGRRTAGIPGVLVEDKRFSLGIHYRAVDEARVAEVEAAVDAALAGFPRLAKSHGKKVFQIEPAMDWDKGKAVEWLLEATGQDGATPIFVGDDLTDEPALAAVAGRGVGVVVLEVPRATAARFSLQNPFEVGLFLERLAALAGEAPR